jgi:hypothetical protein
MEVFVLFGDDGVSTDVLGVYESLEVCQAGAAQCIATRFGNDPEFERFMVERRVVGARPQWGGWEAFRFEIQPSKPVDAKYGQRCEPIED